MQNLRDNARDQRPSSMRGDTSPGAFAARATAVPACSWRGEAANAGRHQPMHKVVQSYLKQFVAEQALESLAEDQQFERFVNFCVVAQFFPDNFDLDAVTTSDADPSIDGVAVLIGEELITTVEDAKSLLEARGARRSLEARYIFCQAKRSDSFDAGEMLKFASGVTSLFTKPPRTKDEVIAEFLEIHAVLLENLGRIQNGRPQCRLYYAATGTWHQSSGLAAQVIDPTVEALARLGLFHEATFEPIDREGLIALWNRSKQPIEATFTVKGTVALPPIAKVTEAYLGLARADDFVRSVLSDSEGRIRASAFEQNVRAFLGEENDVNARMRNALTEVSRHDRFVINNNGITIVSPDVRVQADRVSVSGYQIVNGCQTCHVLFRNAKNLTEDVWVPLKIIEAADPDVVAQLVESTNSQTAVEESQFISIRPFAQRLETYFASAHQGDEDGRLYFERRTNQYAGTGISKLRIFDIPKIARAFAAMFLDLPHFAYMYPTQVLHERRQQLFCPDHSEHAYHTAALALYRLELAFSNKYVPSTYQSAKWHILMLLRLLKAGPDMPRFDSGKIEKYCATLDAVLSKGGKASAPPFLECVKILDGAGDVTRDKRKGQRYTQTISKLAAKAREPAKTAAAASKKRPATRSQRRASKAAQLGR
jgi:hypothetical protein